MLLLPIIKRRTYNITKEVNQQIPRINILHQSLDSLAPERSTPHKELVQYDSHTPPIHRETVLSRVEHFRCDVVWSSDTTHIVIKRSHGVLKLSGSHLH